MVPSFDVRLLKPAGAIHFPPVHKVPIGPTLNKR
jgi:hypothetical protein